MPEVQYLTEAYTDSWGYAPPQLPVWGDEPESHITYSVLLGREEVDITTTRHDIDWLVYALRELDIIARQLPNWDSYGAHQIDQATLKYALDVYLKLVGDREHSPVPQIAATAEGGVALLWHHGQKGLEVEIEAPLRARGYFYDDESDDDDWEDGVGRDLGMVKQYLDQIVG